MIGWIEMGFSTAELVAFVIGELVFWSLFGAYFSQGDALGSLLFGILALGTLVGLIARIARHSKS